MRNPAIRLSRQLIPPAPIVPWRIGCIMISLALIQQAADAASPEPAGFCSQAPYSSEMNPQLALVGPSRVALNAGIDLQVVSLGKDGEPIDLPAPPALICEGPRTPVAAVAADGNDTGAAVATAAATGDLPTTVSIPLRRDREGIYRPLAAPKFSRAGYYRLTVRDPSGVALPFGLPIHATGAEPPRLQLHWGDLHGHSTLSDGKRPPEEYYRWARDVARLDMVALTDHNWALDDAKIERLRGLCREWSRPGEFVPFLAFEWAEGKARTSPARGRPNHKCILFRRIDEDFSPWIPKWQNTPSVSDLWSLLEGRDAIAIPHHTGLPHNTFFGTDWSSHNEKFERLAEVFSDWGSSETEADRYPLPEKEKGNFIRDALARGFHLGMAGGSDTHVSRPGLNAIPQAGHPYAFTALTAVEAPARTHDDLWNALHNRRCYAASAGRRHLLDFTVDGAAMGSRIARATPASLPRLSATIVGAADIREILIIKNTTPVATFPGAGWCQSIEWTDPSPTPTGEDSYYIRAEFEDTSMAWSSPVWVSVEARR